MGERLRRALERLGEEQSPRRNKGSGQASLFSEPPCQMFQAVQKLLPDACEGSWREMSVTRHLESQEPEELAIFIGTRTTDTKRIRKGCRASGEQGYHLGSGAELKAA